MRGVETEPAAAVLHDDVFDDSSRFRNQQVTVLNQRCGAQGMERLSSGAREMRYRVTSVVPQFVWNAQLFAQPDDPLGLRVAEVMNGKHRCLAGEGRNVTLRMRSFRPKCELLAKLRTIRAS